MSNVALREFLYGLLRNLPARPDGRRWTIRLLAETIRLSRSTLYSWLDGGTAANSTSISQLAEKLALLNNADPQELNRRLVGLFEAPKSEVSHQWQFGFVPYPPICDKPSGAIAEAHNEEQAKWTFLGSIIEVYQRATGRTPGGERVPVSAFEDPAGGDHLVGFFATPQRMDPWRFLRTPVQIPLNGIVLWRDVSAFLRRILPARRKSFAGLTVDEYLARLQKALWQPQAADPADVPGVQGYLLPLTIRNEAGRTYVTQVLGFSESEIERRAGDGDYSTNPDSLLQWFVEVSDRFQASVSKPEGADLTNLRLPVLFADELTCLRVLSETPQNRIWRETEGALLSTPLDDAIDLGSIPRPRYSVSIATSDQSGEVESIGRTFEAFVWENTSMIAAQYVRLYRELLTLFRTIPALSPIAALYALRWLSLELSPSEIASIRAGSDPVQQPIDGPPPIPAVRDCAAWADVLHAAKATITRDRDLRTQLREALIYLDNAKSTSTAPEFYAAR